MFTASHPPGRRRWDPTSSPPNLCLRFPYHPLPDGLVARSGDDDRCLVLLLALLAPAAAGSTTAAGTSNFITVSRGPDGRSAIDLDTNHLPRRVMGLGRRREWHS